MTRDPGTTTPETMKLLFISSGHQGKRIQAHINTATCMDKYKDPQTHKHTYKHINTNTQTPHLNKEKEENEEKMKKEKHYEDKCTRPI